MDRAPPQYNETNGNGNGPPRSFHTSSMTERQSVASSNAPFSSIGALLSQPYDSDDEDGRSIRHPQSYQGSKQSPQPQGRGRDRQGQGQGQSGTGMDVRSGDVRTATTRNGYGISEKVQSVEGAVGSDAVDTRQARPRSVVHFPGPNIGHNQASAQSQYNHQPQQQMHDQHQHQQHQARPIIQQKHSGHGRPPPPPQQQHRQQQPQAYMAHHAHTHGPGPGPAPQYPQATHPSMRSPNPNRPQPTLAIPGSGMNSPALSPHFLPQPSTPISPALAAPPSATYSSSSSSSLNDTLLPPRSAFSSGPRSSVASSSASITAYDSMEKTHSLMRGGDDEVMAPLNTRRPQRKNTMSRNALGGMRKTVFGQPGGEFWKRFSVMAKLDTNKER